MNNPWVQLSQEDLQDISRFIPREEIDYYRKYGLNMSETQRSDIQDLSDVQLPPPQVQYRSKVDTWKNNFRPRKAKPTSPSVPSTPKQGSSWDGLPKSNSANNTASPEYYYQHLEDGTVDLWPNTQKKEYGSVFTGITNVEALNDDDFKEMINREMTNLNLVDEDRKLYWRIIKEKPEFSNLEKMQVLEKLLGVNAEESK